jgi:hypothetical protein
VVLVCVWVWGGLVAPGRLGKFRALRCGEIRLGKEWLARAAKPIRREKLGSEKRKETRSNPSVSYKKRRDGRVEQKEMEDSKRYCARKRR